MSSAVRSQAYGASVLQYRWRSNMISTLIIILISTPHLLGANCLLSLCSILTTKVKVDVSKGQSWSIKTPLYTSTSSNKNSQSPLNSIFWVFCSHFLYNSVQLLTNIGENLQLFKSMMYCWNSWILWFCCFTYFMLSRCNIKSSNLNMVFWFNYLLVIFFTYLPKYLCR